MEYTHFGLMLDCSRNAVLRVEQVKRMIDYLPKLGYNTLELYTEDTYEIEGEPYFGYMRGRYTGAEIREIDAYARERGIELIPCIQTLAHLEGIFKHPEYASIRDTGNILLIDEEKTYALIDKMFASLAKNFISRNVNIGMDEAHMVGLGKYLDKHGYQNRFELLCRHVNRVLEIAEKYGFKPHMWSDMFVRPANNGRYPVMTGPGFELPKEMVEKIPKNVDLVFWDYYHKTRDCYDDNLDYHQKLDNRIWFAGAAWSWIGFAPLNWLSLVTMKGAMQSVLDHRVKDVLIAMWGDNGGECSFFSLLPALYTIRQYADGNFDEKKIAQGFFEAFGISYADFFALDLPNHTGEIFYEGGYPFPQNPCKVLLYSDPFMGIKDAQYAKNPEIDYRTHAATLAKAKTNAKEFRYIFDVMQKLCEALAYKARLGVKTREAYEANDKTALFALIGDYERAIRKIKAFHKAFCRLWHTENKPFGWEIQDARLGGLVTRLTTCHNRLLAYVNGLTDKIDELEERLLPTQEDFYLYENTYTKLISWNRM